MPATAFRADTVSRIHQAILGAARRSQAVDTREALAMVLAACLCAAHRTENPTQERLQRIASRLLCTPVD